MCDAPNPEGPLTTRQLTENLCLTSRDPFMSKNGHLGLHIILIKHLNQLYHNSSRVVTSLLIQTYIKSKNSNTCFTKKISKP